MSTLKRAIAIAAEAHAGQVDETGAPVLSHPLRVMRRLRGTEARIVGVLHEILEECPNWTLDRLREEGFSAEVIAALDAVTRRRGEHHSVLLQRAAAHPIARQVKQADLEDSCEMLLIAELSERVYGPIGRSGPASDSVPADLMWALPDGAA